MRLLASADLHGKYSVYEWLGRTAFEHHVDAIVLAGDLFGCPDGFASPEAAQEHEAQMIAEFLDRTGFPVFYIMGNDDLVELNPRSARVQSIHGRRVPFGRYSFVGYQYALPFMGGPFEKLDAEIEVDLAALEELLDAGTIFVSHAPALGILDPGLGGSADRQPIVTGPAGTASRPGTHSRPQPWRLRTAGDAPECCLRRSRTRDDSRPGNHGTYGRLIAGATAPGGPSRLAERSAASSGTRVFVEAQCLGQYCGGGLSHDDTILRPGETPNERLQASAAGARMSRRH